MPNPQNLIGKGFKPGQSGNPAGRTPGSKNMATIIRELLENDQLVVTFKGPNGKALKRKYPAKALAMTLIVKALEGDVSAFRELRRTAYGDKVDMTVSNAESALASWHNNLKEQDEQLAAFADTLVDDDGSGPTQQSVANDPSVQDKG